MHLKAPKFSVPVLLVLALAASRSHAQYGGRGGMGGMGGMGGSRNTGRDPGNSPDRSIRPQQQDYDSFEQIDYRLSLLEDDLRVQPEQRALWESFAGKVRAHASDIARARARGMTVYVSENASGSVRAGLQHIEQAVDTTRNRATALEDIAVAAKNLYAVLAPNQATLADQRMPTLVAPPQRVDAQPGNGNNFPDLGTGGRP